MLNSVKSRSGLKRGIFLGIFVLVLVIISANSVRNLFLHPLNGNGNDFQNTDGPSAGYIYSEGFIEIDASKTTNTSDTGNWTWAVNTFD
ncbi:MAG: hypothetical protein ACTSWY_00100, partial [Promethearchaeota archaeon]